MPHHLRRRHVRRTCSVATPVTSPPAPVPAPDRFCQSCGSQLEEGATFCTDCGIQFLYSNAPLTVFLTAAGANKINAIKAVD